MESAVGRSEAKNLDIVSRFGPENQMDGIFLWIFFRFFFVYDFQIETFAGLLYGADNCFNWKRMLLNGHFENWISARF